ncbi:MAG: peptide-binding protein [Bdellovibrionaceae bacterium]|nr:peptide-binding protein [Pseudobdellovibrionaceae bacterium]MDW8189740.1 peptide-binding protein [Pseudobdellovibrionaceae bacterium]
MNIFFKMVPLILVSLGMDVSFAKINPNAPVGGTFNRNLGGEPPTIHPIMATDAYASVIHSYVFDRLASRDPQTAEFAPRMAERWEMAKDGKSCTFYLRPNLRWHDGKPVTAEDVKFSFDAIKEKEYGALHLQSYYENLDRVEIISPMVVKFFFKNSYFLNFSTVATAEIIPKHVYGDVTTSKKLTTTAVGSGPYRLEKFERGQKIVLKRNPDWYGFNIPPWKGAYNFETMNFRFISEENVAMESLKRNELDFVPRMTPEYYVQKAVGDPWEKTVFKVKAENKAPKSFGFIGWNLRKPLFQDKRIRLALYHLLNREEMNKKFRFSFSDLATGPMYIRSEFADPKVKPVLYDPKKASELLTQAGWKDSDKDGILDKVIDGKVTPFRVTLIYANKDVEKYWTMYQDDLKKAGIDLVLKYLEWNSFLKELDSHNFEAAALAWQTAFDWDPKQIWHSQSAEKGGSNFIGYSNPEVDRLIDEGRLEPDQAKRRKMFQKVYRLIAEDVPYAFLFNDRYTFYGHSIKVEKASDTLNYDVGVDYWWSSNKASLLR